MLQLSVNSASLLSELSNPRVDLRTPTPEFSLAVKSEDGLAVSLTLQVPCTSRCSISVHWRKERMKVFVYTNRGSHASYLRVQFSSVTQSCPTLCDPMNRSTPGLPVHHQLPEVTQTHVHRVSDAIQPSHPLSSPSPPAPNPSQHQSLFQWVNSSHEVAKVLEFQL